MEVGRNEGNEGEGMRGGGGNVSTPAGYIWYNIWKPEN